MTPGPQVVKLAREYLALKRILVSGEEIRAVMREIVRLADASAAPEELRKPTAWRVWAKGRKFTRGLYENPTAEDFAIWQADGDEAEPLYADPQASSRMQIPPSPLRQKSDG